MPTPTIDPVAYEAAYQAVKQYEIDQSVVAIVVGGLILFFMWMFRE